MNFSPNQERIRLFNRAKRVSALRPPWAIEESQFISRCTRCNACVGACPEQIISIDRGYPVLHFEHGECTFCRACVECCEVQALDINTIPPLAAKATINKTCMAQSGVECRVCGDNCESFAISFKLQVGGAAVPQIDSAECTGCGACVRNCPSRAITVIKS